MVFEYILKNHNIDPASDLEIDQSIDFGSTAAAFTGDMSADFTVEFEPSATALEKEGKGYVVASLGVDSGYVPYTSYSAKTSFLNENPQIIQSFTNALQKGMDYVQSHSPEEIAQVISPQFPETDMDTLTTIVKRYYEQDTWKENLIFEKIVLNFCRIFWRVQENYLTGQIVKTWLQLHSLKLRFLKKLLFNVLVVIPDAFGQCVPPEELFNTLNSKYRSLCLHRIHRLPEYKEYTPQSNFHYPTPLLLLSESQ